MNNNNLNNTQQINQNVKAWMLLITILAITWMIMYNIVGQKNMNIIEYMVWLFIAIEGICIKDSFKDIV